MEQKKVSLVEIMYKNNVYKICKKMIEENLVDFLEFCVYSNRLEPVMKVIEIITTNQYGKFGINQNNLISFSSI